MLSTQGYIQPNKFLKDLKLISVTKNHDSESPPRKFRQYFSLDKVGHDEKSFICMSGLVNLFGMSPSILTTLDYPHHVS